MLTPSDSVPAKALSKLGAMALAMALFPALGTRLSSQMLYWTAVNDDMQYTVRRSGLDGSNVQDLTPWNDDMLVGLALDAEARSIFWVVRGIPKSQILRGDLD